MTITATQKTYLIVWAALLVLLLVTWGTAYLPLGSLNAVINLLVASVKALLVMFFFMHLRTSNVLIKVVAFAALFWLTLLVSLSLSDFLSR